MHTYPGGSSVFYLRISPTAASKESACILIQDAVSWQPEKK